MKNILLLTIFSLTFGINIFGQTDKETTKSQKPVKLTAEVLISKHLASIGSPETLAAVKSRVAVGTVKLAAKFGYAGKLTGPAQFASAGDKILYAYIFNSNDYPYDKGAYDGEDITTGKLQYGIRSQLGEFLKSQSAVIKQGLLGGTLSTSWALLNVDPKKTRVEYAGIEEINKQKLHKLSFSPNKSSLKINLYFDPETFRHVRSEYEYVIPPRLGTVTGNAAMKDSRYKMIEQFSDFKTVEGTTLPTTYQINLNITGTENVALEWNINFAEFYLNEPLEPAVFKVS